MRYWCVGCAVEVDGIIEHPKLGIVCAMCQQTIAYAINGLRPHSKTRKLIKIAIRDNWICQLCNKPVDPEATSWKRMPTLDHKHPRSKGGPNAMSNLQLAHGICNHRKANTV